MKIVLKNFLNQQKNIPVLPPFSLNTIMFLKPYKSEVISFQMLSKRWFISKYNQYIIVQKKLVDFNKSVNKRNCKKSNFVPLGERRNRFLKNIPIINNTILVIYSIYTYFLCSLTYSSR